MRSARRKQRFDLRRHDRAFLVLRAARLYRRIRGAHFLITAALAPVVYGYTTKRDLSGGLFLFMGLIGIILASRISMQSPAMHFAISDRCADFCRSDGL